MKILNWKICSLYVSMFENHLVLCKTGRKYYFSTLTRALYNSVKIISIGWRLTLICFGKKWYSDIVGSLGDFHISFLYFKGYVFKAIKELEAQNKAPLSITTEASSANDMTTAEVPVPAAKNKARKGKTDSPLPPCLYADRPVHLLGDVSFSTCVVMQSVAPVSRTRGSMFDTRSGHLRFSVRWFQKDPCFWRKYVHLVLVNRLRGLSLPRKCVVRLTDRPDMTSAVYRGRKATKQQLVHCDCHIPSCWFCNGGFAMPFLLLYLQCFNQIILYSPQMYSLTRWGITWYFRPIFGQNG